MAAAPSGNYLDPSDGNIYYYDDSNQSLTYVGPCNWSVCTFFDTNADGVSQNGQGSYATAWQSGGLYTGLGACANVETKLSGAQFQIISREDIREVATLIYKYRLTYVWRNALGQDVGSPVVAVGTICASFIVANCQHGPNTQSFSNPPLGAVKLCAKNEILKQSGNLYPVYRATGTTCSGE